jgi:hypothetical protein
MGSKGREVESAGTPMGDNPITFVQGEQNATWDFATFHDRTV